MRVLILGGTGMAGHLLQDYLCKETPHDIWWTQRKAADHPQAVFLDVTSFNDTRDVLNRIQPDVVINAIGVLNQQAEQHPRLAMQINGMLPRLLSSWCDESSSQLIHISTDCVFSGKKGSYRLTEPPDGSTVYAHTKAMGERIGKNHLVIRTSIVGPELKDGIGLFHWFMNQSGVIRGYQRVMWNGVTTLHLAQSIAQFIDHPLSGMIHLSSPTPISKYHLLRLFQNRFERHDIVIQPDATHRSDKTLVPSPQIPRPPAYSDMIADMKRWMLQNRSRYPHYPPTASDGDSDSKGG